MPTWSASDLISNMENYLDKIKKNHLDNKIDISHKIISNGEDAYFLRSDIVFISDQDMASIMGIKCTEYIFYLVKEFNAKYSRELNNLYFSTKKEAIAAKEWVEGIQVLSKLEEAGK